MYETLARFYDTLTENVPEKERAIYLDTIIKNCGGKSGAILLDLACGTGKLSEEFALLGYDVIGVDGSVDMLNVAMAKKQRSGLPIQYLNQDMTALDLYGTVDVTVSVADSLNHLKGFSDLKKAVERVALFCNPGGLFIFDINAPVKHREILGNNTFVYDADNVYCVWQNTFFEKECKVNINLDIFERLDGGEYIRHEENFYEYAYELAIIDELLTNCGFEIISKYRNNSFEEYSERDGTCLYITKRKSSN